METVERKIKLAKMILLEIEGLEGANTSMGAINLAIEVIKDAKELAELIEQEERKASWIR